MRTNARKDKIQEALELLNDAANDKKEEVLAVLGDKYDSLKEFFEMAAHNGGMAAGQAKRKIFRSLHAEEEKIKKAAATWDDKVHEEPWAFLGGVALAALALGMILGNKK